MPRSNQPINQTGARVRRRGDVHGFHSGQGSTAPLGAEHNVDIPVPRRGGRRLQALSIEQIVDIPVPVEGLQCFRPGQTVPNFILVFSLFKLVSVTTRMSSFMSFSHFSTLEKSAKVTRQVGVGVAADTSLTDAGGFCSPRLVVPRRRGSSSTTLRRVDADGHGPLEAAWYGCLPS